jgi:hypothetical protein
MLASVLLGIVHQEAQVNLAILLVRRLRTAGSIA